MTNPSQHRLDRPAEMQRADPACEILHPHA
jgi:hypothetical protein